MVQWLRCFTFNAGGTVSIPCLGTKILYATWCLKKWLIIINISFFKKEKYLNRGDFAQIWALQFTMAIISPYVGITNWGSILHLPLKWFEMSTPGQAALQVPPTSGALGVCVLEKTDFSTVTGNRVSRLPWDKKEMIFAQQAREDKPGKASGLSLHQAKVTQLRRNSK